MYYPGGEEFTLYDISFVYSLHHCPGVQAQGDPLHQHLHQPAHLGLDDHWDLDPIIANSDIVAKHNG